VREFIQFIIRLLAMLRDMDERLAKTPATKSESVMAGDFSGYCRAYELQFPQRLPQVVVALDRTEDVKTMASATDPQEALLELLRNQDKVDDKPQHPDFNDEDVVTSSYSLSRTIQSMVTYGRSISCLPQDVREDGNQGTLFKAIRMDRAVIG
jgi:hypothetical protein